MNKKIFLYWRIINTVLLGIALFLPWEVIYSDVAPITSFESPGWMVLFISFEVLIEDPKVLDYFQGTLIRVGETCFIFYMLLNCILVMRYNHSLSQYLRTPLLLTGIFSVLISIQIFEPMFNMGTTWGYWVTCIILLSGLFLEIFELNLLRQTKKI